MNGNWHTVVGAVRRRAATDAGRIAFEFVEDDGAVRSLSYAELDAAASGFAAALAGHAAPGDRALVMCPPGPDYVVALLGCQYAGVVPVPSQPLFSPRQVPRLVALMEDARPAVVITAGEAAQQFPDAMAGARLMSATERAGGRASAEAEPDPDSVALVQYTSGSTGSPRGVVLTHAQILANLDMIRESFSLTEDDFAVLWLPPYHDMGLIGGIFAPLHIGFGMRLMSPASFIQSPLRWLEHITSTGATIGGGPNFAYEHCVSKLDRHEHSGLALQRWQVAFTGAEPIRATTLKRFAEVFGPFGFSPRAFYPCYGLAEATLIVSGGKRHAGAGIRQVSRTALQRGEVAAPDGVDDAQSLISCGRPAPGLDLRIVEPGTGAVVGPGAVGEVRIHGPNVSRGYLRGDSDRFCAAVAGEDRAYLATGDLGFLDETGELFICGRLSDVVVIRGRNIYPHDVEAAVEEAVPLPGISAAFGVEKDDEEGLVVVREAGRLKPGEAAAVLAALRAAIRDAVDVQAAEVVLTRRGALPRTTSGKVRRRETRRLLQEGKLPVLASSGARRHSGVTDGSTDPTERVRAIVAAVLDLPADAVRTDEPAASAGLDSRGAMQVSDRVADDLGLLLLPAALLGTDTLESVVAAAQQVRLPATTVSSETSPSAFPLSVGQRAIWHHEALGTGAAYNLPVAVDLPSDMDPETLEQAIGDLVSRHEALRTAFESTPEGLQQRVLPVAECRMVLTRRAVAALDDAALDQMLVAEAARPLHPAAGEVIRALLVEMASGRKVLLLVVHHLVADAWSLDLLCRELAAGDRPAPGATMREVVAEEARFLSSPEASALLDDWARRLAGIPVVDLPRDRPRPPLPSFEAGIVPLSIDAATTDAIRALARQERTTPFAVMAATLFCTLSRLSGATDIVIGSPAARRDLRHRRELVGLVMNPVPLRVSLDPADSFRDVVRRSREALAWARKGEDIPFAAVVERVGAAGATSVPPIFQTMLAWHRAAADAPSQLPGGWRLRQLSQPGVPLDMMLDVYDRGTRLSGYLRYSTALFDHDTAVRAAETLNAVLRGALAEPDRRHSAIPVIEGSELTRLTKEWARGPALRARTPGVVERFREQAAARPESIAVEAGDRKLTFREVGGRSSALALRIVETKAKAVGLLIDRSPELVIAPLAALMAGTPFVPLDPSLPDARLRSMLEDSGATVVVASEALRDRIPPGIHTLALSDEELPRQTLAEDPDRTAYVIFTSGSTGRPKGVAVHGGALAAVVDAFAGMVGLGPGGAMMALTSTSFDISVLELFLPLVVGARVVVAPSAAAADPELVLRLIADGGVTHLQGTPSTLSLLCDAGLNAPSLTVLCGGEAAPPGLFGRLRRVSRAVWNVYGPTETTVWSTAAEVGLDGDPPLGRPLPGESVYLLDNFLSPVPTGVEGEIYIGGVGVSRGYVGRPALTAERFVPDPFAEVPGSRMYRTGDLARYRADSRLEFRGRADGQLKVRGCRIEREEVEHILGQHPAVARGVAMAVGEGAERQLIAAVQWRPGQSASKESLTEHMLRSLPAYAVPTTFHTVDRMPVTSRGKIDFDAVLASATLVPAGSGAAPATDTERMLAEIWRDVLGIADVSSDDDFFALGGHSLLAQRVVSNVREQVQRRIDVADVFTARSLAALAKRIDEAPLAAALAPLPSDADALLTDAQRRIWAAEQLAPQGTPPIVLGMRIEGPLDVSALERAVNSILVRHDELRARFPAIQGRPVRRVLPELTIRLEAAEAADTPFDVAQGPLVRCALSRIGDDDHVLMMTLHHLVCDATAAALLLKELSTLYMAAVAGVAAPELPQSVGHAEVIACAAQRESPAKALEWWRERLRHAPRLLLTTGDAGLGVSAGEVQTANLGSEAADALRRCARHLGATPFMLMCAALAIVLRQQTGRTDLVIGTDFAGRDDPSMADAVVPLVNQVALTIDARGESFSDVVDALRNSVRETFRYATVSYDKVVAAVQESGGGVRDLFDVKIAYQPMAEAELTLGTARLTRLPRPPMNLREALVMFVLDGKNDVTVELHHRLDVCDRARAVEILGSVIQTVERSVSSPDAPLSLAPPERGFQRRKVRSLDAAPMQVMRRDDANGIVTLCPATAGADLAGWIAGHRDELFEQLAREGALLFRGFACDTPEVLERVVAATGDVLYDTTEHDREQVGTSVFTPIAYPSREILLWHNEDSFRHSWPGRIWFGCEHPPGSGGETVVADGATILTTIRSLAPRLIDEGLMYVRRYGSGLGLDWRTVFATESRDEVEQRCQSEGMSWCWEGDVLTTRAIRPGIKRHHLSGEACWVGQLLHFHPAALPLATRSSLETLYGRDALPRDCRYADESVIDDVVVTKVVEAYRSVERACHWQMGDLLLVDNVRSAHGRRAYDGKRKLLVMLSAAVEHDQ
ncbi:MAG TPA: amino acid adenylation domain-containing protein [Thermoanaerobaculia bacterium]